MRLKIYGTTEDENKNTISACFSILDSDCSECATIERSWNGNYLDLSFLVLKVKSSYFYFPYKITSRDKILNNKNPFSFIKKGTPLAKYYLEDNKCYLISDKNGNKKRNKLYKVAVFALRHKKICKKINIDLSTCKSGVFYSVIIDENNNIVLKEN